MGPTQGPNGFHTDPHGSRPICSQIVTKKFFLIDTVQQFVLVPGLCMNETVIETIPASALEDCVVYCSSRIWCRSFNWYCQTNGCDLFSWYYLDTNATIDNNPNCFHYAYVPQDALNKKQKSANKL